MSFLKDHFNRREFSGAFGDVGTDIPLIAGMIVAADLNPAAVLTVFGLGQIASALIYGIPMPVQPLKAVAALVIAGGISAQQIHGAGFIIGCLMLVLTATGLLLRLRMLIPKAVIRGLQIGLGLRLALLAVIDYIPAEAAPGLILAAVCTPVVLLLRNSRRLPPAIPVIAIGLVYVAFFKQQPGLWRNAFGFAMPSLTRFTIADMLQGAILLALPQIPLSLGNALFATHQLTEDLFPAKRIALNTIGYSYSILNMISAFCGGVPVCHGSGGMAGHYAFGARTGGSVAIYGTMLVIAGIFFGNGVERLLTVFPLPLLGVILATEAGMLLYLARDVVRVRSAMAVAAMTAAAAAFLPYGFLIGMAVGTGVAYLPWFRRRRLPVMQPQTVKEEADA